MGRWKMLIMIIFMAGGTAFAGDTRIFRYEYFIFTDDTERTVLTLRKYASENAGYVKFFSRGRVSLRLPEKALDGLGVILGQSGYLADEQVYRSDAAESLVDLRTRLRVKQKLLADLNKLFNESQFHQTLEVEQEIGRVILEIEKIKGEIAYYKDRAALWEVNVSLNQRAGASAEGAAASKWDWINRLGVGGMHNVWEAE